MSRKKNGLKKALLTICAVMLIVFLTSAFLLRNQMNEVLGRNEEPDIEEEIERDPEIQQIIDELPESTGYQLRRNATLYQIELFELLVNSHDAYFEFENSRNLQAYAGAIVRNFIADFFTLSNKNSRSDIGGLQFFTDDLVDDFRSFATDSFYLYLNHHIETYGREALPTVDSTTILNVVFDTRVVPFEEDEDPADFDEDTLVFDFYTWEYTGREIDIIVVEAQWTYEPTTLPHINEFQTEARFILIAHEDEVRIYVVELIIEEDEYASPW